MFFLTCAKKKTLQSARIISEHLSSHDAHLKRSYQRVTMTYQRKDDDDNDDDDDDDNDDVKLHGLIDFYL